MRFRKEIVFDAPPDEVAVMLADPAFRERVAAEAGSTAYEVSVSETDDGMRSVVDSRASTDGLPGFMTRFIGAELAIHQEEHWPTTDAGTMRVTIPGKPGQLQGTVTLRPEGAATVQSVDADISVNLPLVGGRIEKLIGQILGNTLKLQGRVGNAWLAGDR